MPNPQRDAGIRAENEACRLLEAALQLPEGTVRRRKNEGIHEDIGDLIDMHTLEDGEQATYKDGWVTVLYGPGVVRNPFARAYMEIL